MRAFAVTAALVVVLVPTRTDSAEKDACLECHSNPDFLVTNKKLYDYFQNWRSSSHAQVDVGCVDCHGGNPAIADKAGAHGPNIRQATRGSAVHFQNVPQTCGQCHESLYKAYSTSHHYDVLAKAKQVERGPNCVTCHGSVNATKLDVNTVRAVCQQCHNTKSKNHPEVPEAATHLLNDLYVIRAYAHYVRKRGADGLDAADIESQIKNLGVSWHSFDLEKIRRDTSVSLEHARAKRQAVEQQRRDAKSAP
jgi:hypothetical protein